MRSTIFQLINPGKTHMRDERVRVSPENIEPRLPDRMDVITLGSL